MMGLILLLFCGSCVDNIKSDNVQIELTEILNVRVDSIDTGQDIMRSGRSVANDSLLIITDIKSDTLYRVFSLPNMTYSGWFGLKGRGGSEFMIASHTCLRMYDNSLQIAGPKRLVVLKPLNSDVKNDYDIIKEIRYPTNCLYLNEAVMLSNGMIYGSNGDFIRKNSKEEMLSLNKDTKEVGLEFIKPDIFSNIFTGASVGLYNKYVDIRRDKSKFASICYNVPLLRIYNSEDLTTKDYFIKGLEKQSRENQFERSKKIMYYLGLKVTDRYIYCYYRAFRTKLFPETRSFKREYLSESELHIFDWNGESIARIELPYGMQSFCPSVDDKYIYSTRDYSSNKIYRYYLPEFMKNN